jgi:Winged helix DNA-binding domain
MTPVRSASQLRDAERRDSRTVSSGQELVLRERLRSQLLSGLKASSPLEVVRRLLAVQGQDPRGARLAVRARSTVASSAEVDAALSEERSLLITWLNRGTLHLVASEDYWWLHALTAPTLRTASARRLAQEGVTPAAAQRGVATIARALAEEGPLDRTQLRERLDRAGVRTEGQALVHLLLAASLDGVAVRGPMVGASHRYVHVADWLGARPAVDRERALAELARRYLAGHAPADARDLARWAGLPLRDARAGLAAIARELRERDDDLLELAPRAGADVDSPARLPAPQMLGAFDPVLLGWRSREPLLGANQPIVTINGIFRPFALVRGRAVAVWGIAAGKLTLTPFAPIAAADERKLRADGEQALRYLGLARGAGTTTAAARRAAAGRALS